MVVNPLVLACAALAAVAALFVILCSDVMRSALALIAVLLALAGIYAGLGAGFIAAVQVIVYAGAVMVLFLFAIMVLEGRRERAPAGPARRLSLLAAGLVSLALLAGFRSAGKALAPAEGQSWPAPGIREIARFLFAEYLLPFEVVGLLLLVALVAVMVLGRREEAE